MKCLMYHRIDQVLTNPWGVSVSPEMFELQIQWLVRHRHIITPDEFAMQREQKSLDPSALLISFDDGYADNFLIARPILEKYQCPAIFFIPTFFIGRDQPFWWDELERVILRSSALPPVLRLTVKEQEYIFHFDPEPLRPEQMDELRTWRWYEESAVDRCAPFIYIWTLLKQLPVELIDEKIGEIKRWASFRSDEKPALAMTADQLGRLSRNPLFTIGLHSHTHPDLSCLSRADQLSEISRGKKILKKDFQIDASWFSYPFGLYNETTLEIVNEMDLEGCFTTESVEIDSQSPSNRLGRIQAPNTLAALQELLQKELNAH